MRRRRLGSSGPEISVIGYGAWEIGGSWGSNPPDDEIVDAMLAGFDEGIDWVDTAEVYGRNGRSETVVARALAQRPEVMVFTKVAPKPAGTGFAGDQVREACEKSLRRLGRDRIDLYQLHWPDRDVPVEETWAAMADLVRDGLVRFAGVSNHGVDAMAACEKIRHVDSLQPQFSMLTRDLQPEVFPWCADNGTGIIAYGPLAYGLLTGTIDAHTRFEDNDWRGGGMGMGAYDRLFKPGVRDGHLETVERLRPIAGDLDVTLAQLALAWVVAQPGVTGAIAGSRRRGHTIDNARAGDLELDASTLERIERALAG